MHTQAKSNAVGHKRVCAIYEVFEVHGHYGWIAERLSLSMHLCCSKYTKLSQFLFIVASSLLHVFEPYAAIWKDCRELSRAACLY